MFLLNTALFLVFSLGYISLVLAVILSPMILTRFIIGKDEVLNKIDTSTIKALLKFGLVFGLSFLYLLQFSPHHLIAIKETFIKNQSGIYFIFGLTQLYWIISLFFEQQGKRI